MIIDDKMICKNCGFEMQHLSGTEWMCAYCMNTVNEFEIYVEDI